MDYHIEKSIPIDIIEIHMGISLFFKSYFST